MGSTPQRNGWVTDPVRGNDKSQRPGLQEAGTTCQEIRWSLVNSGYTLTAYGLYSSLRRSLFINAQYAFVCTCRAGLTHIGSSGSLFKMDMKTVVVCCTWFAAPLLFDAETQSKGARPHNLTEKRLLYCFAALNWLSNLISLSIPLWVGFDQRESR